MVVDFRDELGILLTLVVLIRKCLLSGVKSVLGFDWRLTSLLKWSSYSIRWLAVAVFSFCAI